MSKTLYPHEEIVRAINSIEMRNPSRFYVIYYLFVPIIALCLEFIIASYIDNYMKINNLIYITNQEFISIGLSISVLITLAIMAIGMTSICNLAMGD